MQPRMGNSNSGVHCRSETHIKNIHTTARTHSSCSHPHTYKSAFRQRHFPLVNLSTGRHSASFWSLKSEVRANCWEDLSTEQNQIMSASGRHFGSGPKCGSEGHSAHNWGSDLIFWIKASLHNTSVPMTESTGQLLTLIRSLNSLVQSTGSSLNRGYL